MDYFFDSDTARAMVKLGRGIELHIHAGNDDELLGIVMYLAFTGSEKTCWECGGERHLMLGLTLDGQIYSWTDVCDPFDDMNVSAAKAEALLASKNPKRNKNL